MKLKELELAVQLFLPDSAKRKKQKIEENGQSFSERSGLRLSARQRAKREKLEVKRREDEAMKAKAGKYSIYFMFLKIHSYLFNFASHI